MEGHHHRHQHLQQQPVSINVESDRFPQWSVQETKEFLTIRAELDQSFMETKRNKLLWEIISTKMKEKGYNRSAEQCKCKWKNLFTRYKGCGNIEAEAVRQQFPFYDELQAIFTARMQSILCSESEGGGATRKKVAASAAEMSSEEEDMEENELDNKYSVIRKKKKAKTGSAAAGTSTSGSNNSSNSNNIKEILEDFMRQQLQMEMQWREALEARENERRLKEMEWRQAMEALENERIMMERRWREGEEQRRMREEARAEKRDALITALLNKLRREDQM